MFNLASPQPRGSSFERRYDDIKGVRDRRDDKINRERDDKNGNNRKYGSQSRSRSKSPANSQQQLDNKGDTLYISNLGKRVDDDRLREKFSRLGRIVDLNVVRDPFTKDCRGFAFLRYGSVQEATDARNDTDNTDFEGRTLKVEKAKRVRGHDPTPGKYLGHYRSNHGRKSVSPYSRGRYERDLKRRERSRSPRRKSRSRSRDRDRERDRDRGRDRDRDRERDRYRSPSWNRAKGGRDRDRERERDRSRNRDRHRSRSRDRSRDRRRS